MKGLFELLSKRADEPIEKRDYGKVYLLLSGLLFIGTMWSVIDEVSTRRPWKEFQQQYFVLSDSSWAAKLKEAEEAFDSSAATELYAQLKVAEEKLNSPEVVAMQKEVNVLEESLLGANQAFTFAKSRGDEAYYFWKKSIHEGHEDAGYKKELTEFQATMATAQTEIDKFTSQHDSLVKKLSPFRDEAKGFRTKIKELYTTIDLAKSKLERVRSSSIQIRQVMSNNFDRSNFGTPKARIDRCQTCHTGWKDDAMEGAAQPFTKHPLPELLKIHQPESFGCTPCHRGQGTALTAGTAHGEDDHYWEWPLLKGKEVYASCNSCHTGETYLKFGDRYNEGKRILAEVGCFGCHEVKGYTDMPKIGPSLNQLAVKEKADWLFRWVRNPKDYNPHTRMPNFRFTDDQAEAIGAYLWSIGSNGDYKPQNGIAGSGNAARGKQVVETVGCKGCHVIGDDVRVRQARGTSYDIAPELSRAGSKLDMDWMYEWIKNPRAVSPDARMPNLRLSDQDARDVVAYIGSLKDTRQFEQKSLNFNSPEKIRKGEKLVREFGCAGCHAIKGMEKESRVSVSLNNFGRKRVDELDYGDTKVHHTWDEWVYGKLKDARQYTTDRIVSKMPVFSFSDSEIVALRTLLRGYTKEVPELEYQRPFDTRMQQIEAGRRLTHYEYNCVSCHKFEEAGGYIKATLADEALAPPYLFPEGAKVQEPWLHDFLTTPTTIRPWLNIRMPSFGLSDQEIAVTTKYFLGLHKQEFELRKYHPPLDKKYLAAGKTLFDDLQCLSCHYTGKMPEGKTPSDLAPNLALAKDRLKPEWILSWIANPEAIQPGTKMPMYYQDLHEPSQLSDALGADANEQIKAIRDYILTIQGSK